MCTVPEMWFDVTYCEVCGEMWNVTHCHCIIPHQRPFLTFQTAPHSTSHHHSSPYHTSIAAHYSTLQYHISNRTISASLCISRCTPFQITFHITPHSMYSMLFQITPYIGHIMPCTFYTPLHRISHAAPHLA